MSDLRICRTCLHTLRKGSIFVWNRRFYTKDVDVPHGCNAIMHGNLKVYFLSDQCKVNAFAQDVVNWCG